MKSSKIVISRIAPDQLWSLLTSQHFFELVRYTIIGTLSFLTYVIVSNTLHFLGIPALLATLLAAIMSLTVSYFGHIHVTYKVQPEHTRMSWRFLTLTIINLSLVQLLTWIIHLHLGISFSATSLMVSVITPLVSWPVGKFWVFAA